MISAYEEGLIEKEQFEPRIRQSNQRLEQLQEQAVAQRDEADRSVELRLVIGCIAQFSDRVKDRLETIDTETPRQIIRTLVHRIQVDQESVRVVYRLTPHVAAEPRNGASQHWGRCHVTASR